MRGIRSIGAVRVVFVVASIFGAGVAPVSAHHSFGLFDMSKTSEVDGTVTKLEWSNPHCWLFITAATADSAEVPYGFEMTSVGEMIRRGWTKTALKPGDKVKVKFHPVHDGRTAGYMMSVTTADGQLIGKPPEGPNAQGAPAPAPAGG